MLWWNYPDVQSPRQIFWDIWWCGNAKQQPKIMGPWGHMPWKEPLEGPWDHILASSSGFLASATLNSELPSLASALRLLWDWIADTQNSWPGPAVLRSCGIYGNLWLMHFTFINCGISKFLLISDHISLGKDEFRDKTAGGVARIV